MKKILILYTSVGLGHKVVAENIALALKARPQVKVTLLDILEFYKGPLIKASTRVYQGLLRSFR